MLLPVAGRLLFAVLVFLAVDAMDFPDNQVGRKDNQHDLGIGPRLGQELLDIEGRG